MLIVNLKPRTSIPGLRRHCRTGYTSVLQPPRNKTFKLFHKDHIRNHKGRKLSCYLREKRKKELRWRVKLNVDGAPLTLRAPTDHMSYGQYYWLTNRACILHTGFSTSLNMIQAWNPMSILDMALTSLISLILPVARMNIRNLHGGCQRPWS